MSDVFYDKTGKQKLEVIVMKSLREKRLRLATTFIVFSVLAVALIGLVLAFDNYNYDFSDPSHIGYAYVKGWYVEVPGSYYKTYHYGNVSEDAGPLAWTKFGFYNGITWWWDHEYLDPGESHDKTFDPVPHTPALIARTVTYPGSGTGDNNADAGIVPGLE